MPKYLPDILKGLGDNPEKVYSAELKPIISHVSFMWPVEPFSRQTASKGTVRVNKHGHDVMKRSANASHHGR